MSAVFETSAEVVVPEEVTQTNIDVANQSDAPPQEDSDSSQVSYSVSLTPHLYQQHLLMLMPQYRINLNFPSVSHYRNL